MVNDNTFPLIHPVMDSLNGFICELPFTSHVPVTLVSVWLSASVIGELFVICVFMTVVANV